MEELTKVWSEINRIWQAINDFKENDMGMKSDIMLMQDHYCDLKADVNNLKTDVNNLKQDIAGIKQDVAVTNLGIKGMKDQLTRLGETLDNTNYLIQRAGIWLIISLAGIVLTVGGTFLLHIMGKF